MSGAVEFSRKGRTAKAHRPASRRRRRGILAGAAGVAGFAGLLAAAAPQASAQTLTQALAEAYNTNPQLLAQRALLRATDEQVPQALSGWRPTVNFTGQVGGVRLGFLASGAPGQYATFLQNSLNVQITQPV